MTLYEYIYWSGVLCPSSVFSSVYCQLRNTATRICLIIYWLKNNNQTDQEDETKGLAREGLEEGDLRERV